MWRAPILVGFCCALASIADSAARSLDGGFSQVHSFAQLDSIKGNALTRRLSQNNDRRSRRSRPWGPAERNLLRAAFDGDLKAVQDEIGKGLNPDVQSPRHGFTALMNAASKGHVEIIGFLLDNGADVNAKNDEGVSALYLATQENQLDAVKKLLDGGADIEKGQNFGTGITPLIIAAERGNIDIVRELMSRGANVNAKDKEDTTALHFASRLPSEGVDIVKALLDAGAEVNSQDSFGYTPLHFAAWNGQKLNVEVLINRGADKTLETILRQTAKDLSCGCLRTEEKSFCHFKLCQDMEEELLALLE
ncbi:hypothetical protein BSKO_04684 [Bryopsis sp. KO-2023]|nr:hypothetical protein BSKO_04684 [Bryopsis sp. KO-2023]